MSDKIEKELTQEEFDKFSEISMNVTSDSWYTDILLIEMSKEYNLIYISEFL